MIGKMGYLAIALAFLWLLLRFLAYKAGLGQMAFHIGVLLNMFFLVIIPFVALRRSIIQSTERQSFIVDLRSALRPGILYVIMVTAMIYVFYQYIDPGFTQSKRDIAEKQLMEYVPDEASYAAIQKDDIGLKGISREQYLDKSRKGFDMIYATGLQTGGSFIALTFTSIIYGLIISILLRKVLFKV